MQTNVKNHCLFFWAMGPGEWFPTILAGKKFLLGATETELSTKGFNKQNQIFKFI